MYDPSIGRFLSKDTETNSVGPLGYNPYIYCLNNPLTYVDTDGKFAEAAALTLVTFGGGLAASPVVLVVLGIAAVGLSAYAIYTVYNYYSSVHSTSYTQSTSTSSSISASCPAPPPAGNNNNKKSKNKSNSSKNSQPSKPKFEYKEEWRIRVGEYADTSRSAQTLRHTPDQQALKELMEEVISKRGGFRVAKFSEEEANTLVEWGKETGFKDARIDPPHTETINFDHLHVGSIDYIRVIIH